MNKCCMTWPKTLQASECGIASPPSPFKVWQDAAGTLSVFNKKGQDVTEYFNVSIVDGVVVMNYKKAPSLDEWHKIVGKI